MTQKYDVDDTGMFGDPPLALPAAAVAAMTRPHRDRRLDALIEDAHRILDDAILRHIVGDGRRVAAVVGLFSGGNDSTTLVHLFRDRVTHFAHANTTIGIEQTREYVRGVADDWGVPLLERSSPHERDHYRALVLEHGFPGPGHHFKMYQRLKERALEQVQRELVGNPRRERVVMLAGRRRDESKRRMLIAEADRVGSRVFVSPMVNWTKPDMNSYRLRFRDVPTNDVTAKIHMSGECLCGAFASAGEREEITYWFPEVFDVIAELEAAIADRDDIPEYRKKWGWGSDPVVLAASKEKASARSGALCSSCDDRFQPAIEGLTL